VSGSPASCAISIVQRLSANGIVHHVLGTNFVSHSLDTARQQGAPPAHQPWRWLLMNVLILPGWGSIKGGRRGSGYMQLFLGLIGVSITAVSLFEIGMAWIHSIQTESALDLDQSLIWWTGVGVVLFFVSWFWGLATGISLLQEKPNPPSDPSKQSA
jgi:hypothetical protein